MLRENSGRKSQKPELCAGGIDEQNTLASELTDQDEELTESTHASKVSRSSQKEGAWSTQSMANLETILQELRDFHHEISDTLKEIKEDIRVENIDNTERRIVEAEDLLQCIEDAPLTPGAEKV